MTVPSRKRSVRELLVCAQEYDSDAYEQLLKLVQDDLKRVIRRSLTADHLLDEVYYAVCIRMFVYLPRYRYPLVHAISSCDSKGDQRCLSHFRRWATNIARTWTRTVNRYGIETAERWLIPHTSSRRRATDLNQTCYLHTKVWGEPGNESEDAKIGRLALAAEKAGRRVMH